MPGARSPPRGCCPRRYARRAAIAVNGRSFHAILPVGLTVHLQIKPFYRKKLFTALLKIK